MATPDAVVEFQADALELKNQRLPWAIRMCVWMPFLLLAGAVAWACWAKVDVVVQGRGRLLRDDPFIIMKPLERLVISKIHVRPGDMVHKDQVLISFDPAINNAEAERIRNEQQACLAELERLKAEFSDTPFQSAVDNQFVRWQMAIYRQRQAFYKEKMNYYREALSSIDATTKSKQDSLEKQGERLKAFQRLEDMFQRLHDAGAGSLKEVIEVSISRMELEGTVEQIANELLELRHRRGTYIAEQNSFVQEWRNRISEEMVRAERTRATLEKEFAKVARLIDYVSLKAPCDAVVHEVAASPVGSAVREAEGVITLVPVGGEMELEAEIRPQDIGKVQVGSTARIKLDSYPFQRHGTLQGTVLHISENTFMKNNQPAMTYYRARLKVTGKLENTPENFRLIPGMEASCEIKCRQRRVIEYILNPLIKALDESIREP